MSRSFPFIFSANSSTVSSLRCIKLIFMQLFKLMFLWRDSSRNFYSIIWLVSLPPPKFYFLNFVFNNSFLFTYRNLKLVLSLYLIFEREVRSSYLHMLLPPKDMTYILQFITVPTLPPLPSSPHHPLFHCISLWTFALMTFIKFSFLCSKLLTSKTVSLSETSVFPSFNLPDESP